jgi:hypothetical protein
MAPGWRFLPLSLSLPPSFCRVSMGAIGGSVGSPSSALQPWACPALSLPGWLPGRSGMMWTPGHVHTWTRGRSRLWISALVTVSSSLLGSALWER